MKKLNSIFGLLLLVTTTFNQGNSQVQKQTPDISDLEITPEIRDIYIGRQYQLLNQILGENIRAKIPIYIDFNYTELKDTVNELVEKNGKRQGNDKENCSVYG